MARFRVRSPPGPVANSQGRRQITAPPVWKKTISIDGRWFTQRLATISIAKKNAASVIQTTPRTVLDKRPDTGSAAGRFFTSSRSPFDTPLRGCPG